MIRRGFLANTGIASAAKLMSAVLSLPLFFILARTLGKDGWGLFSVTMSILTVARIVSGSGLGLSTGKHLAGLKADAPGTEVGAYLSVGLTSQLLFAVVPAAALWLAAPFLASRFSNAALGPAVKVGAMVLVFFAVCEFAKASLQGVQRFDYVGLITGVEYGGKLVFAGGAALLGLGMLGALNGYLAGLAVACVVAFVLFLRLGMRLPALGGDKWRSIIGYSLPLMATTMGFVIYTELDNLMIGYYAGVGAVGVYAAALFIARGIPELAKPIGQAAAPTIVKLKQSGDGQAADFVHYLVKYTVAVFLPISVALAVMAPKVLGFIGDEYVQGAGAMRVMSVFVLSLSLGVVVQPALDYLGLAWRRAGWFMMSVGVNVILNFLLIPRIGAIGAAVATAVTHLPYVANNVLVLSRAVGLKTGRLLFDLSRVSLAAGAAGAASWVLLVWSDGLVLPVAAGAAVYLTLLFALGALSPAELSEAAGRLSTASKTAVVETVVAEEAARRG